jgi:hypothetical protein
MQGSKQNKTKKKVQAENKLKSKHLWFDPNSLSRLTEFERREKGRFDGLGFDLAGCKLFIRIRLNELAWEWEGWIFFSFPCA